MNKKDLEHTVKSLHLSPEAKDRITRYLDNIPQGEEVFHAEPIRHTSFLQHAGIGIAACAMLVIGAGGIYAIQTAAPAEDLPESSASVLMETTTEAAATESSAAVSPFPDFSDKPTTYTFINETITDGAGTFSFALTSEEQEALSAIINTCEWREQQSAVLREGSKCLVLDFCDSVLQIWLDPPDAGIFKVRYMADKTTGEQTWYEADMQVYKDIMDIVSFYIGAQNDDGILDCIPTDLYTADLRFSFADDKENFFIVDSILVQQLKHAFANANWGYDDYRENADINAWQTNTFLPEQPPAYYLYVHSVEDDELYRCAVWLDTNGSDQIEFLHYADDRLVGNRYSIEFDEDLTSALAACAEPAEYGYAPEKPDAFRAVTIWDDLLLPIEELDLSMYEELLMEFNAEHGTDLDLPSVWSMVDIERRRLATMSPKDFQALLEYQLNTYGEVGIENEVTLNSYAEMLRTAKYMRIMHEIPISDSGSENYCYVLSTDLILNTYSHETLADILSRTVAVPTSDAPGTEKECLRIGTDDCYLCFYSLDDALETSDILVRDSWSQAYYISKGYYDELTAALSSIEKMYDEQDVADSGYIPPFADIISQSPFMVGYYKMGEEETMPFYMLDPSQTDSISALFAETKFMCSSRRDHLGTCGSLFILCDENEEHQITLYLYHEDGVLVDAQFEYTGEDIAGMSTGMLYAADNLTFVQKLLPLLEDASIPTQQIQVPDEQIQD